MTETAGRVRRGHSARSTVVLVATNLISVPAIALVAASLFSRTPAVFAQAEVPGPGAAKLAAEFNDPLTTLPQIFLQDAYTPSNHGTDAQTNRLSIRPIIPRIPRFSLFPLGQLIRPSFSLVTVPTGRGGAPRTEFGDIALFDLAVVPWRAGEVVS